jgi:hypothetical protein
MTEILWKSSAPHLSAQDHELVELRLVELGKAERPCYLVREIHASWSARAQLIDWEGFEDETYESPQEAQRSFARRKTSLVGAGYSYSTTLN